ncbi:Fic family protein [Pseudacidovorax sp. NFM-22]|uniref:Fic family protein n=1 Tax=Pseudacidovorax sp. NFM-22 TaxID=2744469 RepID=UPI001F3B2686
MDPAPNRPKGNPTLAAALKTLKRLQEKHHGVVEASDLRNDGQRALLIDTGFLKPVMKGWYICSSPSEGDGDSTAWYASFWAFVSGYLGKRFGKRYCLNPEASLMLHTGNTTVPRQVTCVTVDGGTSKVDLPFDTSLLVYPDGKRVPAARVEVRGLQVWPVAEALCLAGPSFFVNNPREAEIALATIRHASELLPTLLAGDKMVTAAGRLAAAFEFVQRPDESAHIQKAFAKFRIKLKLVNPFELAEPTISPSKERSPYVLRLRSMWAGWRQDVIDVFPPAPGLQNRTADYLAQVDERYVADAYNSLSIEGYRVTDALIERVARGDWNPDGDPAHDKTRDALAARGYYQAFQAVKESIAKVLAKDNAGAVARRDHHDWHAELFGPSATAGIVEASQLAGYRRGPIFIRNSMHTPLPSDALLDALEALWELIEAESEACVRAVLGHHLFVFIHPYYDGNGRLGRFLMNTLLASGGYPWTVIRMSRRDAYMQALEAASVQGRIGPLAEFIAQEMEEWAPTRESKSDKA